jgi:4,5-DOPA dioxygenase extradiol
MLMISPAGRNAQRARIRKCDAVLPTLFLSHGAPLLAVEDWLGERLEARDCAAVPGWAKRAPHAREEHPTPEHLPPLFVAWGAAGPAPRAERWHVDVTHGALRMDAFAFLPAGRA